MAKTTFADLARFGRLINDAGDSRDVAKLLALDLEAATYCEAITPDFELGAYLWYFRSNIQAALQDLSAPQSWDWRQPHRERQTLYLRRAASHPSFVRLPPISRASIFTNLANSLSAFGRGLEAIALYDEALAVVPNFAMALGNRGKAMEGLLRSIPDPRHTKLVAAYACRLCRAALSADVTWEGGDPTLGRYFAETEKAIASKIDVEKIISKSPLDQSSLGDSPVEQAYRRWALQENLFLNPLLVIGPHSIAATDRMNLPPHVAPVGDPPTFVAWFNQMKQEFVSARWLLYEGTRPRKKHFVDNGVFLVNTLDYPTFGIQVEKLRASFRIAYGLLDKVAGFVNAYYMLGIDAAKVDFRNIWHVKKGVIRPAFLNKENLHLRGLYWLSQDIIGDDPTDQDSIAPEAGELKRLRNLLEHRCLVLRDMDFGDPMGVVETASLREFEASTKHIVRLARVALMYLAFSLRKEESDRHKKHGENEIIPTMRLPIF
jgi:tetratricopeptide (TPR) repeat protein